MNSGRVYLAYFIKNNQVIDESLGGFEIYVMETENGLYEEMLTGMKFERGKFNDEDGSLKILLCQRVDLNCRHKDIVKYKFIYDERSIHKLISRINSNTLSKHK